METDAESDANSLIAVGAFEADEHAVGPLEPSMRRSSSITATSLPQLVEEDEEEDTESRKSSVDGVGVAVVAAAAVLGEDSDGGSRKSSLEKEDSLPPLSPPPPAPPMPEVMPEINLQQGTSILSNVSKRAPCNSVNLYFSAREEDSTQPPTSPRTTRPSDQDGGALFGVAAAAAAIASAKNQSADTQRDREEAIRDEEEWRRDHSGVPLGRVLDAEEEKERAPVLSEAEKEQGLERAARPDKEVKNAYVGLAAEAARMAKERAESVDKEEDEAEDKVEQTLKAAAPMKERSMRFSQFGPAPIDR